MATTFEGSNPMAPKPKLLAPHLVLINRVGCELEVPDPLPEHCLYAFQLQEATVDCAEGKPAIGTLSSTPSSGDGDDAATAPLTAGLVMAWGDAAAMETWRFAATAAADQEAAREFDVVGPVSEKTLQTSMEAAGSGGGEDDGSEAVAGPGLADAKAVLVINGTLDGSVTPAEFAASLGGAAAIERHGVAFGRVPGCICKQFLTSRWGGKDRVGGCYLFASTDAARSYLEGEVRASAALTTKISTFSLLLLTPLLVSHSLLYLLLQQVWASAAAESPWKDVRIEVFEVVTSFWEEWCTVM